MQWEDTFIHKYNMDGYIHNTLDLEKLDEQSGHLHLFIPRQLFIQIFRSSFDWKTRLRTSMKCPDPLW